ncbi:hypothetical protein [Lentilactobacillus kosonis]|uniref:Uncharacterized protein n=1 Tax=Lentilactobacillus kosonis TaxID=2810561 RepID=A0A401FJ89_9LACO|nr:hypothetical protein [Lentilactobacillus kosonis]GAY72443.1 hypothetical protein NBRC111893_589 [Lentilactobacillus kosonis]
MENKTKSITIQTKPNGDSSVTFDGYGLTSDGLADLSAALINELTRRGVSQTKIVDYLNILTTIVQTHNPRKLLAGDQHESID